MNDLADDAKQDLAVALIAEEPGLFLNPEEAKLELNVCEHCGHCPCGCGG